MTNEKVPFVELAFLIPYQTQNSRQISAVLNSEKEHQLTVLDFSKVECTSYSCGLSAIRLYINLYQRANCTTAFPMEQSHHALMLPYFWYDFIVPFPPVVIIVWEKRSQLKLLSILISRTTFTTRFHSGRIDYLHLPYCKQTIYHEYCSVHRPRMCKNPLVDVIVPLFVTRFALVLPSIDLYPSSHYRTPFTHQFVSAYQYDLSAFVPHSSLNLIVCRTV